MSSYQVWKNTVIGIPQNIDGAYGAQCVDVALSWGQARFPGVAWNTLFPPVSSAKDMYSRYNPAYWDRVENNHADVNQVPPEGAVAIFAGSPEAGYSSTYRNPDGHVGVVDHTDNAFIYMVQQDAGISDGAALLRARPWRYTRLIGWLVAKDAAATPTVPPQPTGDNRIGKTLFLHPVPKWRVYRVGAQPLGQNAIGYLRPDQYNHGPGGRQGLTYPVLGVSRFPNTVTVKTDTYGVVDIYMDKDAELI